jgi:proton-dependent oligopeptide transporter, POT family
MSQPSDDHDPNKSNSLKDVKQLGLWAALASLSYVFWIVGAMEMVERLAYYGVRAVATIYATRPASEGGLGVTMATFGTLLMCWNLLQSVIPIFTGGLSDRYGYKETIAASTAVKCLGYLIMAWFPTYNGFFVGAMFLAVGTAIFKPGIQGTLVKASTRENSSMAWGVFYQTVNIGGWIGPLIALQMRHMSWTYVFYTNAALICINFLLLLTYREPGKDERLERRRRIKAGEIKEPSLFKESLQELRKKHLWVYLAIFSVWWFMFPMLWDVLPKFIDDWVDTRVIVRTLFGESGTQNPIFHFLLGMNKDGLRIEPEGIVNLNALMIMLTCFLFAALSSKMRATTSLFVGTLLVVAALVLLGLYNLAWMCVAAMVIFSIGEMLASPKYSEFLGNIAPSDKKAMWIGFSQAPILIGWTIEGKVGPLLYHHYSSKDVFARKLLVERGMDPADVTESAIPIGEAFTYLVQFTGESPDALNHLLYHTHNIGFTWYFFAAVGVFSAVMIYSYGVWVKKLAENELKSAASKTS